MFHPTGIDKQTNEVKSTTRDFVGDLGKYLSSWKESKDSGTDSSGTWKFNKVLQFIH